MAQLALEARRIVGALVVAAALAPPAPAWGEEPAPPGVAGYLPAVRQELARLDLRAHCDDTTETCTFTRKPADRDRPDFKYVVRLSRATDTIYIYIDNFIVLADKAGPPLALARKLLALNRKMVTGKFEWDESSGSIRLSTTLNTDSNFDRRAFRSQLEGLHAVAVKLGDTLDPIDKRGSAE